MVSLLTSSKRNRRQKMAFGDIALNMDWDEGLCRCHGRLSPRRTTNGDVAVITDELQCIMQRIAIWMATERGERPLHPDAGCCIRDFFNATMTSANLLDLKAQLRAELADVFPEFRMIEVEVRPLSRNEVQIKANIGNFDIEIIGNPGEVRSLQSHLNQVMQELRIGG